MVVETNLNKPNFATKGHIIYKRKQRSGNKKLLLLKSNGIIHKPTQLWW